MTGAPKHNYTQERSTIIIPSGGVEKKRIKKNIFDNQTVWTTTRAYERGKAHLPRTIRYNAQ